MLPRGTVLGLQVSKIFQDFLTVISVENPPGYQTITANTAYVQKEFQHAVKEKFLFPLRSSPLPSPFSAQDEDKRGCENKEYLWTSLFFSSPVLLS